MKHRVMIVMIAILAVAGTAMAGWLDEAKARLHIPNSSKTIQTYLPAEKEPRPVLEIKDNGMLGYHFRWDDGYREPVIWGGPANSVLYNPTTQNMLVLIGDKKGKRVYHAYHLEAAPMQKLLGAMSAHWEDYKAYVEKPTPEGEAKVLAHADVVAALESVKDTAKRKETPSTMSESEALAQAKEHLASRGKGEESDLDIKRELGDVRHTDVREAAFETFLRGEEMSRKYRGESMFSPQITPDEVAAGAATKVRLYYLGAWLHAIAADYRPKVFKTVKLRLNAPTGFVTKREIADLFAVAEKTAVIDPSGEMPADPDTIYKGSIRILDGKVLAVERGTDKTYGLEMTNRVKGMLAIGEIKDGTFLFFKKQEKTALLVPSPWAPPLKLEGRVVGIGPDRKMVLINVTGIKEPVMFYLTDPNVARFVPEKGLVDFTVRNLEVLRIEQQR